MKGCYEVLVGTGFLKPIEFWALDPAEVWWLWDARRPRKMYGSLTESDAEALWREAVEDGLIKDPAYG